MKLNTKGQVTIPADIRERNGLHPGDEIEVVDIDDVIQIRRVEDAPTRGQRATRRLRGTATTEMSTDELMALLRDD